MVVNIQGRLYYRYFYCYYHHYQSFPSKALANTGTFPSLLYITKWSFSSHFFTCSVAKLCPTFCDPMDCSMPGFPVLCFLPEFAQTHVHWVGDPIQPSRRLSPCSPAFNLSQHQDFFQRASSLHEMAKVLEFQLQYQPFQWIFRVVFL